MIRNPDNLRQKREYVAPQAPPAPEEPKIETKMSYATPDLEPPTFDYNQFANRITSSYKSIIPEGAADSYNMGINLTPGQKRKKREKPKAPTNSEPTEEQKSSLLDVLVAVLKIPTKFDKIFEGITNAGLALSLGLEGAVKSSILGVEDIVSLITFLVSFFVKYLNCIISFFVNLPACFVAHIITCVASVLYLIFPLTAFIFRWGTGIDLMPYFESAFRRISDGDDMLAEYIGFHFTKFPPSIIQKCYTCNNRVVKVNDILTDVAKIKVVGDKITHDMTKKIPDYMRPATPYLYKTAEKVNQVFS